MLVCGIELSTHEAIICLLDYNQGAFKVPDCRQRSFTLPKSGNTQAIRDFHFSFHKLMEDYKVDELVIIERAHKGKLAGSALSFKLEAAIELTEKPVSMINHTRIKEQSKRNRMQADFESLGLKKFQQPALNAAYAYQCETLYKDKEE
jgi:hypothetical protein